MSELRTAKNRGFGRAWGRIWDSLVGNERSTPRNRKPRRLTIDSLEQRQLLSVSPVNVNDVLINQALINPPVVTTVPYGEPVNNLTFYADSSMLAGKSVAMNNNGDFVVVWQSVDPVGAGTALDPDTGKPFSDTNIYARYYTNAVQRIDLPINQATGLPDSFALQYNGKAIEKLSITAGNDSFGASSLVSGTFRLTYTGAISTYRTQNITFDESSDPADMAANAEAFRQALQDLYDNALPAEQADMVSLDGVTVQAISSKDFVITLGDGSVGLHQTALGVAEPVGPGPMFSAGYLPSANVTMVRNPGTTIPIHVSSDPTITARNIQYAFSNEALYLDDQGDFQIGPIMFPPDDSISTSGSTIGPYYYPDTIRAGMPTVTVTARSATEFDITFTGDSGKQQQTYVDSLGVERTNLTVINPTTGLQLAGSNVKIIKQSSNTFRVNAPEPDDLSTNRPEVYDQTNPQVAMDADGDFVITWQSVVPELKNPGSVVDIFARRFSAAGWVDSPMNVGFVSDMNHDGTANINDANERIQGVVPMGGQFQVNTTTTNAQSLPSVGMDSDGNFTIAWQSQAQGMSYFNFIDAQRYDRDGNPLGGEFQVTNELTTINFAPYVAMSHDSVLAIAWSETDNPTNFLWNLGGGTATSWVKVYDAKGALLVDQQNIGGWLPTVDFDSGDNFVVTYEYSTSTDMTDDSGEDVFANQYQLYDPTTKALAFRQTKSQFRINSATFLPNDPTHLSLWPNSQSGGQVAMDADGDMTTSYSARRYWSLSGYGADVSEDVFLSSQARDALQTLLDANSDLKPYVDPTYGFWYGSNGDVDGTINAMLLYAKNVQKYVVTPPAAITDVQLGRLRVIFEKVAGLMRGEANGALFSQFDANLATATESRTTILTSDDIANSNRDGSNTSYIVAINPSKIAGQFHLQVTTPWGTTANTGDVVVYTLGAFDPYLTMVSIHDKLSNLSVLWKKPILPSEVPGWPQAGGSYTAGAFEGTVAIRQLSSMEVDDRETTAWDLSTYGIDSTYAVYEVTFMGAVHDVDIGMYITDSDAWAGGTTAPPVISALEMQGFDGTKQYDSSIAMTASGNFVMVWNEDTLTNSGSISNTNLYFREFSESTDTAGPLVTDFIKSDGERLKSNETVREAMNYVVVSFDEDMMNTGVNGANSVINPNNWALMFNGTLVSGGIAKIYYGMNEGATRLGAPASNKWEAVIELNGSGNSQTTTPYLQDGHYEIVATNALRDISGNTLGRTGYQPNGATFSRSFDVLLPTGTETRVNSATPGEQYTNPCDEIQQIRFTPPTSAVVTGTFKLTVNGYESGLVMFDSSTPASLAATAAGVQAQLLNAGYTGAVVSYFTSGTSSVLSVRFGGVDSGIDQPVIAITSVTLAANVSVTVSEVQKGHPAPTPQATASNANGDYVVVWTSDATSGAKVQGVYATMYPANWTETSTGHRVSAGTTTPLEILVRADASGITEVGSASVASDGVGNFVVTWSERDNGDWNVWYRRYDAVGNALGDAAMVNTTTNDIQRYSTVAMDADGDFVIAWQSMNEDGDGYGIYAQRFTPTNTRIGGTDELDILSLAGRPVGYFDLTWNGKNTYDYWHQHINVGGRSTAQIAVDVAAAMAAIGATVSVDAISGTDISIQFTGADGSKNQGPVTVVSGPITGDAGAAITISTRVDGAPGEIRVNDTTANNQIYPSIAMDEGGAFVVSWTSYGQAGDAAYQSNVYAKQYVSNHALRANNTTGTLTEDTTVSTAPGAVHKLYMTTTDDPASHIVQPGTGMDGVVQLVVYRTDLPTGYVDLGSGVLLADGRHILTAAHVVADDLGNMVATRIDVIFAMASGYITLASSGVLVCPEYTGSPWVSGGDVAVITLAGAAPAAAERHDINRTSSAVGQVFTKVGYGNSGTGLTGDTISTGINAPKRSGQNKYEGYGSLLGDNAGSLVYDFDSGQAANDVLGIVYNVNDLGVGTNEICGAPGDSGGPNFLSNGLIAGITSYGTSLSGSWDVLAGTNSSFGDIGADADVSLYATWIDAAVLGGSAEMLVNTTTAQDQKWSSVAMDTNGDFVVTWTSYGQDGNGNGPGAGVNGENGVYARRFDSTGTAVGTEFLVTTFTESDQQYSKVAMNAAGDFAVVWESYQDRPANTTATDAANSFGIYGQRFVRTSLIGTSPTIGPNGEYLDEFRANTTTDGDQRYPSIAMDDNGDFLVVWSGNGTRPGQTDSQGVFMQRFDLPSDKAGARVIQTYDATAQIQAVDEGQNIKTNITTFIVTISEDLTGNPYDADYDPSVDGPTAAHSVMNPSNWSLTKDGAAISGGVTPLDFYFDATTHTYQVVLKFDSDAGKDGAQELDKGAYVLTARANIWDKWGVALDGDLDGLPGGNFTRSFSIGTGSVDPDNPDVIIPGPGTPPAGSTDTPINIDEIGWQLGTAVACNAQGEYVIVWTNYGSGIGGLYFDGDIIAQRFNKAGKAVGTQFVVNNVTAGDQSAPDVAMDSYGNFVVVWAGVGADDDSGVYARAYDQYGVAVSEQFRVNQYVTSYQDEPSVAMDTNGDFVVTWTSAGQDSDRDGIFARQFNMQGQATTGEFLVNTRTANRQDKSDVAMDDNGDFVVVWESYGQDASSWGIYGQRFDSSTARAGGEFQVNGYTNDKQVTPAVAMDAAGDFVVTWASFGQDGSGYGIYARQYNAAGGAGGEFQVNNGITMNYQMTPDVSMNSAGTFAITWSSFGRNQADQGNPAADYDYGIYARVYNGDGSDFVTPAGATLKEFRLNATTDGDQTTPAIALADSNVFAATWVGPDSDESGIFSRLVGLTSTGTVTNAKSTSAVAVYDPASGMFFLRYSNSTGYADTSFTYGPANSGWLSLVGDWNGDGIQTVGLYDPVSSVFYLRNSNTTGYADITFGYGPGGAGWTPLVGDWNGDGIETVGLYDSSAGTFYLRNTNTTGYADQTFGYGMPGWTAIVGDWDGNGTDTIGLYYTNESTFFLRNSNTTGYADVTFCYGPANAGWTPLVGDANGDGVDTIGLYDPTTSSFYMKDSNTTGFADKTFAYGAGNSGWKAMTGTWLAGGKALDAKEAVSQSVAPALTQSELDTAIAAAVSNWAKAGLNQDALAKLAGVQFTIGDLSGAHLGMSYDHVVVIDTNAAGNGWFVDSTPDANEEFVAATDGTLKAVSGQAVDRIDLLTVVEHELGHVLGLDDVDSLTDSLMKDTLEAGVRRSVRNDAVDLVFASE